MAVKEPTRARSAKATATPPLAGGYALRPYRAAERLRARTGLDAKTMARFLGVDEKTYARRARSGQLKGGESLKVDMLERVLQEAIRVLGDEEEARHWLVTPIVSLDRRRPLDHLTSIEGYERVKNTLGKIEYGLY